MRIVVKLGTNTLTDATGRIDRAYVAELVAQVAQLKRAGHDLVIVTSGAIAAGLEPLGLDRRPDDIPSLQAAAAVGQSVLIDLFTRLLAEQGLIGGQILLTRSDTAQRGRYLHARDTFERLLELAIIPIVNENDTVAVEEIRFGDNDTLAALVGTMIDADRVVLLTDVAGLYTADPRKDPSAELVSVVHEIDHHLLSYASGVGSTLGSGGMVTKLRAARVLLTSGITMVLCNGRDAGALVGAVAGTQRGTYFEPDSGDSLPMRKRWIATGGAVKGSVVIDDGAVEALQKGGVSLLSAGVRSVEGDFEQGAVIALVDGTDVVVAKGLTQYASDDLRRIAGKTTEEAAQVIPGRHAAVVVHCDQMVLF